MAIPLASDDVLTAINGILAEADSPGKIVPLELLGIEDGDSPDLFRSDDDGGLVHAWQVFRGAAGIKRQGDVAYVLEHANRTRRADKTWSYTIKLYYEYATGSTASNSRKRVDSLIDTVQKAFFKRPKLGLANENLRQHNDLQFGSIKVIPAGDLKIHLAVGRLDVVVWESIDA
jgi:hypothetical protein